MRTIALPEGILARDQNDPNKAIIVTHIDGSVVLFDVDQWLLGHIGECSRVLLCVKADGWLVEEVA